MPTLTVDPQGTPESADSQVASPAAIVPTEQEPVGESIVRGGLALLSTQPLTWAATILSIVAIPQLVGSEALGQYTVVFSVTTLVATAVTLGIPEYLVQRIARKPSTLRADLGIALLVLQFTVIVGALLIIATAPLLGLPIGDGRLLYVALAGMIATPAQVVLLSTLRGQEKIARFAWFNALSVVLGSVGGVAVLLAGGDIVAFAAVGVGLSICSTIVGWNLSGLRPSFPRMNKSHLRPALEFVRGGFAFLAGNLALSVSNGIDRVLLGLFVPVSEVGWYAATSRIIGVPIFLPTLINTPLFPALSRGSHEPQAVRRIITQTLRIMLLAMAPMSAGIIAIAPAIPSLLRWPADFENAVPLIEILSATLPLIAVDMVLGVTVMALGRQSRWVLVQVLAALLNIGLNIPAIHFFETVAGNGAIGASLVTLLTELFLFAGALALLPKRVLEPGLIWIAARIFIAAGLTVVVARLLLGISLGFAIPGGAITYVLVAMLLGALRIEDVRALTSRFSRRVARA